MTNIKVGGFIVAYQFRFQCMVGGRDWWSRVAYIMAEREERGCGVGGGAEGWGRTEGQGRTENAYANWLSPRAHLFCLLSRFIGCLPHTFRAGLLTQLILSAVTHGHTKIYFDKCPGTSQSSKVENQY